MIFEEIQGIIKLGTPNWVLKARKEHITLNVHINGKGTDLYLDKIDSIENPKQLELRRKYLTTNRHIFVELSRPIDKVFSAKGGGVIIEKGKEDKIRPLLTNIRHGKNIRSWIKDIQANKYYTDPAGLVFFEWEDGKTYPTIKSINSIMNYSSDGRTTEWVLFEPYEIPEKEGKYYRFVDAEKDYLIKRVDDKFTIIDEFDNPFGECPAIINSNIINSELTYHESPFEIVISLADHYLRTGTIKNINEFLHGYPIFWRYLADCKTCQGSGFIEGKVCHSCNGTGVNTNKDITDIINLQIPEKETDIKLAPEVAGYVTPDVSSWQEMRDEQDWLFDIMQSVVWGAKMSKDASNETATAAFLNAQPVNDQLNNFTDAFEDMERKMTSLIVKFHTESSEPMVSVNYGRRYLVELADAIWKRYEEARKSGANKVSLDYMLTQFYQSEYANDLESLAIAQKGILLEPFVHKTDEEIQSLILVSDDMKIKKYLFNEWFKRLDRIDVMMKSINELELMFNKYIEDEKQEVQRVQSDS